MADLNDDFVELSNLSNLQLEEFIALANANLTRSTTDDLEYRNQLLDLAADIIKQQIPTEDQLIADMQMLIGKIFELNHILVRYRELVEELLHNDVVIKECRGAGAPNLIIAKIAEALHNVVLLEDEIEHLTGVSIEVNERNLSTLLHLVAAEYNVIKCMSKADLQELLFRLITAQKQQLKELGKNYTFRYVFPMRPINIDQDLRLLNRQLFSAQKI